MGLKTGLFLVGCCLCTVLLQGCNGGGSGDARKLNSQYSKVFASADPQVKELWEKAGAAIQTNGFSLAMRSLREIMETNATPEQISAAGATAKAVSDQMYDAANKGDANAKEALNELRKASGR